MQPFKSHTGIAVPLIKDDINTDQVAPVQAFRQLKPDYKKVLFSRARLRDDDSEDPDFVLNKPQFRNPGILVTGNNFGAGSSREAAVWSMIANNIRVIVARSFADIYRENCLQNGLLPVVLNPGDAEAFEARVIAAERLGAVHRRSGDADHQRPGRTGHQIRHLCRRPHAPAGRARRHRHDVEAHRRDQSLGAAHRRSLPVAADRSRQQAMTSSASCPRSSRASTSSFLEHKKDVDRRDKPGHDEDRGFRLTEDDNDRAQKIQSHHVRQEAHASARRL